jgi:TolB-like protein
MNPNRLLLAVLSVFLCGQMVANAQDIDAELSQLTDRLAVKIQAKNIKKIAVIDFTDLQDNSSELGKYIAEQLTVDFVMTNHTFSVMDRANINRILAEHKLTTKGLIDPDNCKQLGKFAGVDAIILGKIIPKNQDIILTAKIIKTETSEIAGGDRAEFKKDKTIDDLLSKETKEVAPGAKGADLSEEKPQVVKTFGNLVVQVNSLRIVNNNQYLLTMLLTNKSPSRALWIAANGDQMSNPKASLFDANGAEFRIVRGSLTGIPIGTFSRYGDTPNNVSDAIQIPANGTITATLKFQSPQQKPFLDTGACKLQLEFLMCGRYDSGSHASADVTYPNLTTPVDVK